VTAAALHVCPSQELEKLFAAKVTDKKEKEGGGGEGEGGAGPKKEKKPEVVTLIDPKTSNNTAIAISRFKKSANEITQEMRDGNVDAFTLDQLAALLSILPSAEDVELVQGFDGPKESLGKAEQFFFAVSKVPRYQIRTKCMLVRATFPEKYGELAERIGCVGRAAKQVRKSAALKQVLEYALALGNYLNGGSNKGAAWGFKLDSLNKLSGTKTADNASTLLHYMAKQLEGGNVASGLAEQLPDLEVAARTVGERVESGLAPRPIALPCLTGRLSMRVLAAGRGPRLG